MKSFARSASIASLLALGVAVPAVALAQQPAPAPRGAADTAPRGDETLDAKISVLNNVQGGLTAEQVGKRAESTSYDVRARQAEVAAAQAEVDRAVVGYFPRLSLTGSYRRLSPIDATSLGSGKIVGVSGNTPDGVIFPAITQADLLDPTKTPLAATSFSFPLPPLNQWSTQAVLALPLSDYLLRTSQNYSAASHSERSASLNVTATKLKANSDAKIAYYTWARARLQRIVAEQNLLQAQGHLKDAQAQFAAGTASKADVLRTESTVATGEQFLARAKNFEVVTEDQLRTVMHDPSNGRYEIGEDLRADLGGLPAQDDSHALFEEAIKTRPELQALDETVLSLKQQSKAVNASAWPRLDASGEVTYANPNQRIFPQTADWKATWSVGAQITWSPNDMFATNAQTKGIDARTAQTEAQRAAIADGLRIEIQQAQEALRDATTAITTSARGLAAAEESYRVRHALFVNGRATNVELTDAESDLTTARLNAINARIDLRIARVRIAHAVGRDATAR